MKERGWRSQGDDEQWGKLQRGLRVSARACVCVLMPNHNGTGRNEEHCSAQKCHMLFPSPARDLRRKVAHTEVLMLVVLPMRHHSKIGNGDIVHTIHDGSTMHRTGPLY